MDQEQGDASETGYDDTSPKKATRDEREYALAQAVNRNVAGGWRVESQSSANAILVKGKRVNHVLHVILSVVTAGLWIPVWIILAIVGGEKRMSLTVDPFGNIQQG